MIGIATSVKDCLEIGLLQNASIIGGKNGLWRRVERVSVVEFNGFKTLALQNAVIGNEMAITAFSFLRGAPTAEWCKFLQGAVLSGIACFVVFYIGTVATVIPPEFLDLADQAEIPILLLPGQESYAYADLIMPICERILNDNRAASADNMLFGEILSKMLSLGKNQQNIQTLLTILCQQTHYNLILTDTELSPFAWSLPSLEIEPAPLLRQLYAELHRTLPFNPMTMFISAGGEALQVRFQPIRTNKLIGMLLILQPQSAHISIHESIQLGEVLSTFLQLWRLSRGQLTELELCLDGDLQNVNPQKYQKLAVIGTKDGYNLEIDNLQYHQLDTNSLLSTNANFDTVLFKGTIVLAGRRPTTDFFGLLPQIQRVLFNIPNLCMGELTVDARQSLQSAYHSVRDALPLAALIFHQTDLYTRDQIAFVNDIAALKASMGIQLQTLASMLTPLKEQPDWDKLFQTLSTTYLDCGGSHAAAAQLLHVHVNTIKYRIGRTKELLDMQCDTPINHSRLITALAIERLLQ